MRIRKNGFTLIEIMVVIGIVAFLLAIALANYHSHYLRVLDQTTSSAVASDFEFASLNAKQGGLVQNIQFRLENDALEIVNAKGFVVKSTVISPSVQIGVSGFQSGSPPVHGSAICVFPTGAWLSFSPNGSISSQKTAMIAIATAADWRVIFILPTGAVVGPTRKNILAHAAPNNVPGFGGQPSGQSVSVSLLDNLQPATSDANTMSLIQKIKNSWGL